MLPSSDKNMVLNQSTHIFLKLFSNICCCFQEDSGVVHTSVVPSPCKDSSLIKPSEIFGQHNPFVTPCSVPSETVVSGKNAAQTTRVEHFLCPSAVDIQVTCGSQVFTLDFSMSLSNA